MLTLAQTDALATPSVDWRAILPVTVLVVGALLLLAVTALLRRRPRPGTYAAFAVAVAGIALGAAWVQWTEVRDNGPRAVIGHPGAVVVDGFSVFVTVAVCAAVILGVLLADDYLRRERLEGPEFYVLTLLSASGALIMAQANDLIVLFLGLEVLSISLYVLAGYHSRRSESQEAAMKYFVLGAFSSAFLLYGIALVYGAVGSTSLPEIAAFLRDNTLASHGVFLAGMGLLLVGLGFKVAAVPFHMWTPDVYQGSPTPVTGFMAAAAKAAGFAGLLRVFFSTFNLYRLDWQPVVWALAVLSLVVGSVLAVVQDDVKRMLAYSSIAHAGYVLIGLQAGSQRGIAGSLFYLLTYTFMVLGSFGVVTLVGRQGDASHDISSYRGLSARRPVLALTFTVLLLAQAGVPLTTGFFAKFYVIGAAVASHSYVLAIVAMVAAVVSFYFYLRVIVAMYMSGPEEAEAGAGAAPVRVPVGAGVALVAAVGFTLVFGFAPSIIVDFARHATLLLS
jgi:NADH-quinone oxidoreductase subunit N